VVRRPGDFVRRFAAEVAFPGARAAAGHRNRGCGQRRLNMWSTCSVRSGRGIRRSALPRRAEKPGVAAARSERRFREVHRAARQSPQRSEPAAPHPQRSHACVRFSRGSARPVRHRAQAMDYYAGVGIRRLPPMNTYLVGCRSKRTTMSTRARSAVSG
jgi:hypothetical protein